MVKKTKVLHEHKQETPQPELNSVEPILATSPSFSNWDVQRNTKEFTNTKNRKPNPDQILSLQRTIGNQAVARMLNSKRQAGFRVSTNRPTQTNQVSRIRPNVSRITGTSMAGSFKASTVNGVIQRARTPLTTKEVIGALKGMKFMKKQLNSRLHRGAREIGVNQDLDVILKEEKVDRQISKVLQNYDAHFAKKSTDSLDMQDAMMLSMALEGVSRVIAERLNDVSVQSQIAAKLFEVYKSKISSNLKSKKWSLRRNDTARKNVLDLAQAFLAGNPVTQFMHDEISKTKAATLITDMAAEARKTDNSITDTKMFVLLEQKFQAQMASYSQEQLHKDDTDAQFSTREAHGEYSTYFFKQLFGDNTFDNAGDKATWTPGAAGATDRLAFTAASENRLQELRNEITNPTATAAMVLRPGVKTHKQESRLQELENQEAAIDQAGMRNNFVNYFMQRYSMKKDAAETLYDEVETFLNNSPLTLTIKAKDWFDGANPPDPEFKPAAAFQQDTDVNKIFGKTAKKMTDKISHLPTWNDSRAGTGEERGKRYLRFRIFKDQAMTGLNDFAANEMPVFAALNVNWEGTKGSDSADKFGSNYYGDMHLRLKRQNVANRMIHTATDHGQPRRNPMLALSDFTFGGRGLTKLKDVKRPEIVDGVVNAARTKMPLYGQALVYEIQIYGGLDITKDVQEIVLSNDITDALKTKIENYYTAAGVNIPINRAGAAPDTAIKKIDDTIMKQMLRFNELNKLQQDRINKAAKTTITSFNSLPTTGADYRIDDSSNVVMALKAAYSFLYYIQNMLRKGGDMLSNDDIQMLEKLLAEANPQIGNALSSPQLDASYKGRIRELAKSVKEELEAVKAGKNNKRKSIRLPKDLSLGANQTKARAGSM